VSCHRTLSRTEKWDAQQVLEGGTNDRPRRASPHWLEPALQTKINTNLRSTAERT
jgi:hypothetical protein